MMKLYDYFPRWQVELKWWGSECRPSLNSLAGPSLLTAHQSPSPAPELPAAAFCYAHSPDPAWVGRSPSSWTTRTVHIITQQHIQDAFTESWQYKLRPGSLPQWKLCPTPHPLRGVSKHASSTISRKYFPYLTLNAKPCHGVSSIEA